MAVTSTLLTVAEPTHVGSVRRAAEALARRLGFHDTRAGELAIVVSELSTNILKHAQRGEILLTPTGSAGDQGVEVLAIDAGGGVASLPAAMEDGHSTAGTLGQGLGAVRRLSDTFDLFSQPGKGTVTLARLWAARRIIEPDPFRVSGVNVPIAGEDESGDDWSASSGQHYVAIVVADGLGHGPLASDASRAATVAFDSNPFRSPTRTLEAIHGALRSTRGAAVGIATVEFERDVLTWAALGNIGGSIVTDEGRRTLVSHNGIAGHTARRVQEFTYPMPKEAVLVMHSDGMISHWNPADYPGLWMHDTAVVAGVLYRDFSRRRDDTAIVVGRRTR